MTDPLRITHILVPIDGSDTSRRAARYAVQLAQAFASEVTFLHVVSDTVVAELAEREPGGGPRAHERLVEQGRAYLADVARLAAAAAVTHGEIVGDGDPCAVICETAARLGADLVVMGKIGQHGARRILVGSIARRVVECSDRPVLIVARSEAAHPTHVAAGR
jgi:nucleotide-binding universal stress UspA family protein